MVRAVSSNIGTGSMCIILGSYNDLYGGRDKDGGGYSIFIEGEGRLAWVQDDELELVERNRPDMLKKFQSEYEAKTQKLSDLDWIFSNGNEVLEKRYGASVQSLANCFGLTNIWGASGEGVVWQENAEKTILLAYPFLVVGDKDGYLAFCDKLKRKLAASSLCKQNNEERILKVGGCL